jgi:hypothetical protein
MAEVEYIWGPEGSCLVLAFSPHRCGRCYVARYLFVNDNRTAGFGGTVCWLCWGELPAPEKRRQEVLEKTA